MVPAVGRPAWPADHPVLCSEHPAACVHAASPADAPALAPALDELRGVAGALTHVLGWPAPKPDAGRGPNAAFDVYLSRGARRPYEVVPDPDPGAGPFDESSAFALVPADLPAACARPAILAEVWARAALHGVDTAANDALAGATAAYLGSLVAPCEAAYADAVDDYQASPWSAITQPALARGRGAMLFPWFLQSHLGLPFSADLLQALYRLSTQRSDEATSRWANEPDLFDTLRSVMRAQRSSLADLLLEYAIARAFAGDRDNGLHLPDSRHLGRAGRVRFDWGIDWATLPRTLAPTAPLEPTGATYLWLGVTQAPAGSTLGVRMRWEMPALMRFALITIGADGLEASRRVVATSERAFEAETNLELAAGAAAVLVVGTNVGSLAEPFVFDPDEMPYEPQSYLIELIAQR
jgi:hypothetical protein